MGEGLRISGPPVGVGLTFDVSMWPLAVITMPPVTTPDDIVYMQRCYEHVFAAPVRHALLVDTTSIVAGRDLLVQPVGSACCPFGREKRFSEFGHLELLFRPEVFSAVEAAL